MIVWHIFWSFENLFDTFASNRAESKERSLRKNASAWPASTQEDAVDRVKEWIIGAKISRRGREMQFEKN